MEFFILVQGADKLFRIQNFNGAVADDISGSHGTCFVLGNFKSLGTGGVEIELDTLEVQHDLGNIFHHVLKRIEFMFCIVDTNRTDRRSVER